MGKWRLGLDLGETSIGWCAFELEKGSLKPTSLLDAGVRIFPSGREPRSNEPLAVARRLARQRRRQLDRRSRRQDGIIKAMEMAGLLPENDDERKIFFQLDPYECRHLAAEGKADAQQLGRALIHLSKRRGFKSGRKDLTDDEKSGGTLREGMSKLADHLREFRKASGLAGTLGQLLWQWQQEPGRRVRFRPGTEYYPERWMYEKEFEIIKKENSSMLDEDHWNRIENTLYFQRPLKDVERGKCFILTKLERCPQALPSFEIYRLWANINNLRWYDEENTQHNLTDDQRHSIFKQMLKVNSKTFTSLGKSIPNFLSFNLASDIRPSLEGCPVIRAFNKAKFPNWNKLTLEQKDDIVYLLLDLDSNNRTKKRLIKMGLTLNLDQDLSGRLRELSELWSIEEETLLSLYKQVNKSSAIARFSPELLREIIPIMAKEGVNHRCAITDKLGYALREDEFDGSLERLPYYGEVLHSAVLFAEPDIDPKVDPIRHFGRIGNPTVHRALNQVRLIVNSLIDVFGKPEQIVIELTRDLKRGQKAKQEYQKIQNENKKRNDRARKVLEENGISINYTNLLKVKLWEELGKDSMERRCVYSGENISLSQLFAHNSPVEIEHILPFSRTYDDSPANKTLCYKQVNVLKGNRSPFEAFGNGQAESRGIYWREIIQRATKLPYNKRLRFTESAMVDSEEDHWIERQLNDTAYISKQSTAYLKAICKNVWAVPGRLTALLRRHWRLNNLLDEGGAKNREDHRHHAIDAFVVGLTSRSVIQHIGRASRQGRVIAGSLLEEKNKTLPLVQLRNQFTEKIDKMAVSFKPDHNTNKRFFAETAYGMIPEGTPKGDEKHNVVTRVAVDTLESGKRAIIRDPKLRKVFEEAGMGKAGVQALKDLGVKRIRITKPDSSVQTVSSAPFKGYALDGYAWCDIWRLPNGKVESDFVSYLDANKLDRNEISIDERKPHPAAKRLLRLYKNDFIRLAKEPDRGLLRVVEFSAGESAIRYTPCNSGEKGTPSKRSISVLVRQGVEKIQTTPLNRGVVYASDSGDLK